MAALYAIYKGEDLLATGTAKELAEELNIKRETIWWYASTTQQKRAKDTNRTVAVRL